MPPKGKRSPSAETHYWINSPTDKSWGVLQLFPPAVSTDVSLNLSTTLEAPGRHLCIRHLHTDALSSYRFKGLAQNCFGRIDVVPLLCPFGHFELQKKRRAKVAQSNNKSAELIWSPVGSFWGNPPPSPLNSQTLDWLGFRHKALVLINWALLAQYVVFGVDLTAPQSKPVCHDEAGSLRHFLEVLTIACRAQTVLLGQHALLLHRTAILVAHGQNKFCYRGWRCAVQSYLARKYLLMLPV